MSEYTRRRKKNNPKSVHLVGTDRPEATMIYAGFYHEILASNPLHPIKLTLVSGFNKMFNTYYRVLGY